MLEEGVIQESQGPWSQPLVIVTKKDGSQRFCVDFRKVNSIMKNQIFPMPRVDKVLDNLGHACYFTTLDLASGKYQWGHKTEIKLLFAPVKVMPICLINASYTFQKMMQLGLGGLQ